QSKELTGTTTKSLDVVVETNKKIGQIVVDMQFQDRVSQNIIITINIINAIVEYLDQELAHSLPNVTKEERKKLLDIGFARNILEQFRLGQLQQSFVNHLVNHGYIK